MADKESTLAIVIRTVDQATAGIRKIKGALDSIGILAAPIGLIGERLGALAKEAGLPKIVAGFKGLGEPIEQLGKRLLVIGGAAVGAVLELKHLVSEFDDLGDKAEAMGVSADFLAQMRFAAERSGAEVDQLDSGIKTLSVNMGLLRANTGKMKKFLEDVSPALAKQLKGAKTNEQAFMLLARAMAKIKDPAKRAALAQKTLGDADLGPLFARGADGIEELRKRFLENAGSMADAVEVAGVADDAFKDLNAAITGVKAALVAGLGPALRQIVDELRKWFAENRGKIAEWAKDFGRTLPDKIHRFAEAFLSALSTVTKFVQSIGGLKTVAIGVAAVMAGPLVSAFVTLGVAMLSTPFGVVLASLAAMSLLVLKIIGEVEKLADALDTTRETALEDLADLSRRFGIEEGGRKFAALHPEIARRAGASAEMRALHQSQGVGPFSRNLPPADFGPLLSNVRGLRGPNAEDARIKVEFINTPRGTRVTADADRANLDLNVGHSMLAVP